MLTKNFDVELKNILYHRLLITGTCKGHVVSKLWLKCMKRQHIFAINISYEISLNLGLTVV